MNDSRTDSHTNSVSAHVATHDRKGREGKGREGKVVLHASCLTDGGLWITPRAPHHPAHRPPMQQSQIGGWLG